MPRGPSSRLASRTQRELQTNVAFVEAFARIECHFMANECFLTESAGLLHGVQAMAHIPTTIVHGRLDLVCRPRVAHQLHKLLPASQLNFVFDAGHSMAEPGIVDAVIRATDEVAVAVRQRGWRPGLAAAVSSTTSSASDAVARPREDVGAGFTDEDDLGESTSGRAGSDEFGVDHDLGGIICALDHVCLERLRCFILQTT